MSMRGFYGLMLLVFAVTLFVSATLLFLVQPMVGKMILPLLGGTPAVWNTCMVFFQAMLLLGYLYAHLTSTWLGVRKQARRNVCTKRADLGTQKLAHSKCSPVDKVELVILP